jgi:hypothetical protein
MYGSAFARSTAMTARLSSHERVILFRRFLVEVLIKELPGAQEGLTDFEH